MGGDAALWRWISTGLAATIVILGLVLWQAAARLHAVEQRALHALDWCTTSDEDREHL